jgi:plastocyanin
MHREYAHLPLARCSLARIEREGAMKQTFLAAIVPVILLSGCGAAAPTVVSSPTAPATATATALPTTAPIVVTATSVPPTATNVPPTATAILLTPLPPSPTLRLTPPLTAKVFNVTIKNFEFAPRDVKISVGTTVTWVVEQGEHTTTSDDFRSKEPNAWHSGNLSAGQKFSFTFQNAGEFRFFCGFHSEPGAPLTVGNMNGLVTVSAQ